MKLKSSQWFIFNHQFKKTLFENNRIISMFLALVEKSSFENFSFIYNFLNVY